MNAFCRVCLLFLGISAAFAESTKDSERRSNLSIDYADVEIRELIKDIADREQLNVVIPDTLQGRTSVKLRDVTWKQAFRVVLDPVGYTWIQDGELLKVVAIDDLGSHPMRKTGKDEGWIDGPWYVAIAVCVAIGVLALCHIALCIGVLRDQPQGGTAFAPKVVWAILVLAGGVLPAVGYWIIHHSTLRSRSMFSADKQ